MMTCNKYFTFLIICLILSLTASQLAWTATPLFEDPVISDTYNPGIGKIIGTVSAIKGGVIIHHAESNMGFKAKADLPLYQKDTILTQKDGRVNIHLIDGSEFKLLPSTKLVITHNIYNPSQKTRSSYLDMSRGKARFLVAKFFTFRESSFKVRTPTAIAGVRGSDFVISATPELTEITALENTTIDVTSLARPDEEPIMVRNSKRIRVPKGASPLDPEWITSEEAEGMTRDFLATGAMASAESVALPKETGSEPVLLKKGAVAPIGTAEERLLTEKEKNIDDLTQSNAFERQAEDADFLVKDIIQEETLDHIVTPSFPGPPSSE